MAIAATEPRFYDTSPVFTADGRYLAFLSRRSFVPVYDEHVFDLSFPNGSKPYMVPLSARTPSPFGPTPDGRPAHTPATSGTNRPGQTRAGRGAGEGSSAKASSGEDTHPEAEPAKGEPANAEPANAEPAKGEPAKGEPAKGESTKDAPPTVRVDPEGLPERVVALPVAEARYRRLRAGKDCLDPRAQPAVGARGGRPRR